MGEAISPLTLPAAGGGNGTLSYSLTPAVSGLVYVAATRTLSGTPISIGSYAMTYQAVDGDANTSASDPAGRRCCRRRGSDRVWYRRLRGESVRLKVTAVGDNRITVVVKE